MDLIGIIDEIRFSAIPGLIEPSQYRLFLLWTDVDEDADVEIEFVAPTGKRWRRLSPPFAGARGTVPVVIDLAGICFDERGDFLVQISSLGSVHASCKLTILAPENRIGGALLA